MNEKNPPTELAEATAQLHTYVVLEDPRTKHEGRVALNSLQRNAGETYVHESFPMVIEREDGARTAASVTEVLKEQGQTLNFVPTLGSAGHEYSIKRSEDRNGDPQFTLVEKGYAVNANNSRNRRATRRTITLNAEQANNFIASYANGHNEQVSLFDNANTRPQEVPAAEDVVPRAAQEATSDNPVEPTDMTPTAEPEVPRGHEVYDDQKPLTGAGDPNPVLGGQETQERNSVSDPETAAKPLDSQQEPAADAAAQPTPTEAAADQARPEERDLTYKVSPDRSKEPRIMPGWATQQLVEDAQSHEELPRLTVDELARRLQALGAVEYALENRPISVEELRPYADSLAVRRGAAQLDVDAYKQRAEELMKAEAELYKLDPRSAQEHEQEDTESSPDARMLTPLSREEVVETFSLALEAYRAANMNNDDIDARAKAFLDANGYNGNNPNNVDDLVVAAEEWKPAPEKLSRRMRARKAMGRLVMRTINGGVAALSGSALADNIVPVENGGNTTSRRRVQNWVPEFGDEPIASGTTEFDIDSAAWNIPVVQPDSKPAQAGTSSTEVSGANPNDTGADHGHSQRNPRIVKDQELDDDDEQQRAA